MGSQNVVFIKLNELIQTIKHKVSNQIIFGDANFLRSLNTGVIGSAIVPANRNNAQHAFSHLISPTESKVRSEDLLFPMGRLVFWYWLFKAKLKAMAA